MFSGGLNEAIDRLKGLLQTASSFGVVKVKPEEIEGLVRILLAMYHGLAIQLLTNPEKIRDRKIWVPVKKVLVSAFQ